MKLRLAVPACALVVVLAPGLRAQPTPADLALGKALFEDGRKALAEGRTDEACGKLGQSYALDPALGTLLNLAVCHEKQGKTASAWAEFNNAADLAAKGKETKRQEFAAAQARALVARLAHLVVRAQDDPARLSVRLDGREIGAATLGTAVPLDPGVHRLEVAAPGKRAFTATVKIDPGSTTTTVEVPPLADEAAAPPRLLAPPVVAPPPPVAPPVAPPPPPVGEAGGRSLPRFAAGLALGGVGLAGVVVGSIFGVRTFQKKGEIGTSCDARGFCDPTGVSLQQDAHRSATLSTVGFAIGLTAVAAGVVLVATAGTPGKPKAALWIAPTAAGLRVGGAF